MYLLRSAYHGIGVDDWNFEFKDMDEVDDVAELETMKGYLSIGVMTPNDVIRNIASKFGLTVSKDPNMDMHYFIGKGQSIEQPPGTLDGATQPGEVVDDGDKTISVAQKTFNILSDLQNNIIKAVEVDETGNKSRSLDRRIIAAIKSLKRW